MTRIVSTKPTEETEKVQFKRDTLLNATPAQIDNWIETNITNLATAKDFLKKLTKMVRIIAREIQ